MRRVMTIAPTGLRVEKTKTPAQIVRAGDIVAM
jgi:hypothetical protein